MPVIAHVKGVRGGTVAWRGWNKWAPAAIAATHGFRVALGLTGADVSARVDKERFASALRALHSSEVRRGVPQPKQCIAVHPTLLSPDRIAQFVTVRAEALGVGRQSRRVVRYLDLLATFLRPAVDWFQATPRSVERQHRGLAVRVVLQHAPCNSCTGCGVKVRDMGFRSRGPGPPACGFARPRCDDPGRGRQYTHGTLPHALGNADAALLARRRAHGGARGERTYK